jgi:hypothetical protein
MKTVKPNSIVYSPSPWPYIVSIAVFPVIVPVIVAFFVSVPVAIATFFVCAAFFYAAHSAKPRLGRGLDPERSTLDQIPYLDAIGAGHFVRLTPEGIEHAGWFPKPFRHTYAWDDIHSLRLHTVSNVWWADRTMIAFTPVDEHAQPNYRCPLTGTIGVRAFGDVEEMLETMIAGHRQFSRNGLPSVGEVGTAVLRTRGRRGGSFNLRHRTQIDQQENRFQAK